MSSASLGRRVPGLKGMLIECVRRAATGDAGGLLEAVACRLGRAFPDARPVRWLCFHTGEALGTCRLVTGRERLRDHRGGGAERVVELGCGALLILPLADTNWRHLYFHGSYEPHVAALVKHLLQPGETAVDIGANNGFYTALFADRVGPAGRVHAFEANPALVDRLTRMIALNGFHGRVRLNPVAVSDRAGTARLYLSDHLDTTGMSSLVRKTYLEGGACIDVATTTLDDYALQRLVAPIALLKMDIEGAEISALRGMEALLRARPPRAILCEVADNRHSLATEGVAFAGSHALIEFLKARGYRPFRIAPGGLRPFRGEPVQHDEFCFLHGSALGTFDHLIRD
jgi:FkbM family methyltransferase